MHNILYHPREVPAYRSRADLDDLCCWAFDENISDLTIKTDQPIWGDQYGRWKSLTRHAITQAEMNDIIDLLYGSTGTASLKQARDLDFSYEAKISRHISRRFRVNITSIMVAGGFGVEITMRALPDTPPDLSTLDVPPALRDVLFPGKGLVFTTGPTGSGKSTLQAAVIKDRVLPANANEKILTFEAPVEFVFDTVHMPSSIISQTEIPRQISSFAAGARGALRRNPSGVVIGESRDLETLSAAIQLAQSGHYVYSTLHTNSVDASINRVLNLFPDQNRAALAADLLDALHLIVTQNLLPTTDGKRVAVREYCYFSDALKQEMFASDPIKWPHIIRQKLIDADQHMLAHVRRLYSAEQITQQTLAVYEMRYG